ncbi:MAG: cobalamin biosynthesis protein CobD [Verrucomicrobia bacterium]|nr:cobalamin biosynthesis protein CobD [Verrucomicrobiota bacterium]
MWPFNPLQILAAMAIDLAIGDPNRWPHIARYAGALSSAYERWLTGVCGSESGVPGSELCDVSMKSPVSTLNQKPGTRNQKPRTIFSGLLFWFLVVGTMLGGYLVIRLVCSLVSPIAGYIFDILVVYQAIAARDLHKHAKAVLDALRSDNLEAARERLSWIVGRDTQHLDQSEISRATIESVAESLVDGIVGPLFWALIGGAPGALIYRTANTLDSMVGHRTQAYEKFGKPAARIDDVLNWLPARICALIICILRPASWLITRREAKGHASPNAGWPEAAMAYTLGVRLGGTNFYNREPIKGPLFNASGRVATVNDIKIGLTRIWWVVFAVGSVFLALSSISFDVGSVSKPVEARNLGGTG